MSRLTLKVTYIGGPTALLQLVGLRILTDPTFDPAATQYVSGSYTLRKTASPALLPEGLGRIDIVLLSHDHHFDNLDHTGRELLKSVGRVLTTPAGAARLGSPASGLGTWQNIDVPASDGKILQVTSTPARHGPADHDRGPVTGFALTSSDAPDKAVYISGDTVWFEDLADIGKRFSVNAALLFMGAARVLEVGPWHLTLTAEEAIELVNALPNATIIPLHFEGWAHFSGSREEITGAFAKAGLERRLCWPLPGREITIDM